ncbi:MAG: helix-hairpin-helix domain-containing protein [Arachidicoccus sp.]|nr:helix-hairpin-helix domain-containing protein [Arachidicoccus sp.]
MKKFNWKDYFIFSKKERRFAVWIIVIVGIVTFISIYFQGKDDSDSVTKLFDKELTDSAKNLIVRTNTSNDSISKDSIIPKQLFVFDPNTLDENGWKKLGLPQRTIHTIINYRSKGGKFYKPEDLKKIYGLDKEMAEELIPYVSLQTNKINTFKQNEFHNNNQQNNYPVKKYTTININSATEEEWKSLPGIGEVLSKRIVKFRNSKGSFASIDEVGKTYGLQDSVFQKIKPYLKLGE